MNTFGRVLALLALVVAGVFLTFGWVLPVTLSVQTVRKPPRGSRLVPHQLSDNTIDSSPGRKLSYFGYTFEIPWTDIDSSQSRSFDSLAILKFHSGLKLAIDASPSRSLRSALFSKSGISQAQIDQTFRVHSDYDFFAELYNFTPGDIHRWALFPQDHYRESLMLDLKATLLEPQAETGFFYVGNADEKGFQQGDPQSWSSDHGPRHRSNVLVQLFSGEGILNLTFFQKDFNDPMGISQPQLNRIIQSVHRIDSQ